MTFKGSWQQPKMRIWLTDGVKALNLPDDVKQAIANGAKENRANGKGRFSYIPLTIVNPTDGTTSHLVASYFVKAVKQNNIDARPGDCSITLRSEWNVRENPLDDHN